MPGNLIASAEVAAKLQRTSVTELKKEVDGLSLSDLAELSGRIAKRDIAEWDAQIDRDFGEGGRLRPVLDEVRAERVGNHDRAVGLREGEGSRVVLDRDARGI